jgi:hypothetical protein
VFFTHTKCDFYTQCLISTRSVNFTDKNVILTHTRVSCISTFCSSFDNVISSVAIVQSFTEDVWAAGKSVAAVLVVAYDCTPYK